MRNLRGGGHRGVSTQSGDRGGKHEEKREICLNDGGSCSHSLLEGCRGIGTESNGTVLAPVDGRGRGRLRFVAGIFAVRVSQKRG